MHIDVVCEQNVKVKSSFKQYVQDSVKSGLQSYLSHVNDENIKGSVELQAAHKDVICHIVIHGTHDIVLRTDATASSPSGAFESAMTKLIGKMRKYKDKFVTYHKRASKDEEHHHFKKTVADYDKMTDSEYDDYGDDDFVIEEKKARVERLSSVEAVMKMDLSGLGGLSYIDIESGNLCFVYKREDGDISFIDSGKKF